jgi:hypothetical protein
VKWTGARETTKMNLERVSIILVSNFLVLNVDSSLAELVCLGFLMCRDVLVGHSLNVSGKSCRVLRWISAGDVLGLVAVMPPHEVCR